MLVLDDVEYLRDLLICYPRERRVLMMSGWLFCYHSWDETPERPVNIELIVRVLSYQGFGWVRRWVFDSFDHVLVELIGPYLLDILNQPHLLIDPSSEIRCYPLLPLQLLLPPQHPQIQPFQIYPLPLQLRKLFVPSLLIVLHLLPHPHLLIPPLIPFLSTPPLLIHILILLIQIGSMQPFLIILLKLRSPRILSLLDPIPLHPLSHVRQLLRPLHLLQQQLESPILIFFRQIITTQVLPFSSLSGIPTPTDSIIPIGNQSKTFSMQ